jgi:DNA-binding transcriptional regulator YhcF (GntR family)
MSIVDPFGNSVPFVAVDTSRDRAGVLAATGKWQKYREDVLRRLYEAGDTGMTWRELSSETGLHHGQISGVLSKLHEDGLVFALVARRAKCHPYVHSAFRVSFVDAERRDVPTRTKASTYRETLEHARAISRDLQTRLNDFDRGILQAALGKRVVHLIDELDGVLNDAAR